MHRNTKNWQISRHNWIKEQFMHVTHVKVGNREIANNVAPLNSKEVHQLFEHLQHTQSVAKAFQHMHSIV
jgi:hypothetical protein